MMWALATGPAHADSRPLWEAGLGLGVISFPDYRGSDERRVLALPFPYFVYRGEHLKVDRQGVRGLLVDTRTIELDFSLNATPPLDSKNNQARRGMPDLDPTFEIGPSVNVNIWRNAAQDVAVELRLPLRASIATDFTHVHNAGLVFQPNLALDFYDLNGWKFGALSGLVFGDRRQHQYFYGVPAQYATAARPAYDARSGYAGAYLTLALKKRFGQWWLGGFARADTLNGAVFRDSPLVRSGHAFYAGVAASWIFAESQARVDTFDPE